MQGLHVFILFFSFFLHIKSFYAVYNQYLKFALVQKQPIHKAVRITKNQLARRSFSYKAVIPFSLTPPSE